jgi:beta-galactosidase beta subunit
MKARIDIEDYHRFIDVHLMKIDEEQKGLNDTEAIVTDMEYETVHDCQLFDGKTKGIAIFQKEEFIMLFTGETPLTAGSIKGISENIEKIVFKSRFVA